MPMRQRSLGGSAANIKVGEIGYGLMGFTAGSRPIPDEQSFEAMKGAIEAGATFWNAGVFYGRGPNGESMNLELIARFFTKYPELADKVFLSVKGGLGMNFQPDGSEEFLRKEVDGVLEILDGKKKLDMFQCARVDPNIPIETTIGTLAQLVREGKFDHIGLSEVSASSIRRAFKIHPIATVEIEYSLWATEAKDNGVLETAKELGIAIIAYSPLGRGILAGKWKTWEDLPMWIREHFPRYSAENFEHNSQFLHMLQRIAEQKGVTPAQVAIKWVLTAGDHVIPIPGATTLERVKENMGAANIEFINDELQELNQFATETEARGPRYGGQQTKLLFA